MLASLRRIPRLFFRNARRYDQLQPHRLEHSHNSVKPWMGIFFQRLIEAFSIQARLFGNLCHARRPSRMPKATLPQNRVIFRKGFF